MLGILIIGLLIASIGVLSVGYLMVALRMGKNFNQMGDQPAQPDQQRHRAETRR